MNLITDNGFVIGSAFDFFISSILGFIGEITVLSPNSLTIKSEYIIDAINSLLNYLYVFTLGLAIIYFIFELNQQLALDGRDMNMKTFFAPFLKLLFFVAILSQGPKIVGWILDANNGLINWASTNFIINIDDLTDPSSGYGNDVADFFSTGISFITGILMIFPMLLLFITGMIVKLIFFYKTLTYKMEVLLRVCFFPLALCDVYNGQNSRAISYLKGLLGMGLYGMCFIIIPKLSIVVSSLTALGTTSNILELIEMLFMSLMGPIASIGMLSIARNVIKEALG